MVRQLLTLIPRDDGKNIMEVFDEVVDCVRYTRICILLQKGDVLLHGHTHVSECKEYKTYTYCNPGSVSIPKDGTPHGHMLLVR